jgi:hypothetical protein
LFHRVILYDRIVRGHGIGQLDVESSCRNPRFAEDLAMTCGFGTV